MCASEPGARNVKADARRDVPGYNMGIGGVMCGRFTHKEKDRQLAER